MKLGVFILSGLFAGCSLQTAPPLPPRPALPEVRYVAPCDAHAVVGLTQDAVEVLRNRDLLWQRHVEQLEQQLRGAR